MGGGGGAEAEDCIFHERNNYCGLKVKLRMVMMVVTQYVQKYIVGRFNTQIDKYITTVFNKFVETWADTNGNLLPLMCNFEMNYISHVEVVVLFQISNTNMC